MVFYRFYCFEDCGEFLNLMFMICSSIFLNTEDHNGNIHFYPRQF